MASLFDMFQDDLLKKLNESGSSYRAVVTWLRKQGVDTSHQALWGWHMRKMKKISVRHQLLRDVTLADIEEESSETTFQSDQFPSTPSFFPTVKTVGTGQGKRGIGSIILEEQHMLENLGLLGYSGFVAKKGKF